MKEGRRREGKVSLLAPSNRDGGSGGVLAFLCALPSVQDLLILIIDFLRDFAPFVVRLLFSFASAASLAVKLYYPFAALTSFAVKLYLTPA